MNKKLLWLIVQILIFGITVYSIAKGDKDADIFFFISESVVTFPSSAIVAILNYFLSKTTLLNNYSSIEMVYIFINWLLFNLLGYLQWFIFIPYIKFKSLRKY